MKWNGFAMTVARRYLRPSRRSRFLSFITAASSIGIALGTCALLISLSILQGFDETLESTIIDFMGHIELSAGYRADSLENAPAAERKLETMFPEISSFAPYVRREAIIRSDDGLEGVLLKGVDARRDISVVRSKLVAGNYIDHLPRRDAAPGIVIGERLSDRLRVSVGDTVVLFIANGTPDLSTAPMIEQFRVGGIYRSGMAQYDDVYVFTSIDDARELLGYNDDVVSGFDIRLHDPDGIRDAASRINDVLGVPYLAVPVFDLFMSIFAWIDLQRLMIPVVMAIIAIVATFNVVSTLLITVIEKTESIATLSTLGASPRAITAIFVSKGVLVAVVGVLLGAALTLGFSLLQMRYGLIGLEASIYVFDAVPIAIEPLHYLVVITGTILLAVVATLIPAVIASRLKPVAVLRFR